MNFGNNGDLRRKVGQIYSFMEESLYLNRPDMEINGCHFNSTLLMSLLTGLCQGKELIVGEPGLGKTTSAEYVCALMYQFPLATIWNSEVSGHPEQTEEKIIGRPDLGKLNQGEEFVIWSNFALLPVKIVDEINRLPETKQSIILNGVDRGNWEYLNDAVINREYCLFATANYQDRATHAIIAPLLDRFDVMVESKHPGPNLAYIIGTQGASDHFLRHEELEAQFKQVFNARISYGERMVRAAELCERFGGYINRASGIQSLSQTDRRTIRSQLATLPYDLDANAFLRLVLAELSFCYHFGQKRSHETCVKGCHFTEFFCHAVRNCVSNRLPMSVRKVAQALAWFLGDESVDLRHLKAVLPYTLAHRIQWNEAVLTQHEKASRIDPLEIYLAHKAVGKMHRRYMEQATQVKDALAVACRIVEGEALAPIEGDHPLYCPWDLATHFKLYSEAKSVLKDKEMARKATDYFMDVVADTSCVSQNETCLPNLYRHLNKGFIEQVIHALLQRIWGLDLGVEGHEDVSRKLSRLPYLDRASWPKSIRRFSAALLSLLEMEKKHSAGSHSPNPMGQHSLEQYSSAEIEEGLKELAQDAASPDEFKNIIYDFEDEIMDASQLNQPAMGIGAGRSLDADLLYYMKLAENYHLPIRRQPLEKSGSLYPHHHVPWEISRPYQDVDPWTSFGKIMPGITQTWQRDEGEVYGCEEGIPNCILIIDSSQSMTNPRQELSYAVLGAGCAGDAYLRNDAQVAVYNFSDAEAGGRKILPYSGERRNIYRCLCHYFGGGTRLGVEHIEALQSDDPPDLFLITDMQIVNLQHLIHYFNDCKNRVTAVHIGDNKQVREFRRSLDLKQNVGIYAVEHQRDIPLIVLGKIREYFY